MGKYKRTIWKYHLKIQRWKFWAWMMDHFPKLYNWCDKHLPIDTLPF